MKVKESCIPSIIFIIALHSPKLLIYCIFRDDRTLHVKDTVIIRLLYNFSEFSKILIPFDSEVNGIRNYLMETRPDWWEWLTHEKWIWQWRYYNNTRKIPSSGFQSFSVDSKIFENHTYSKVGREITINGTNIFFFYLNLRLLLLSD